MLNLGNFRHRVAFAVIIAVTAVPGTSAAAAEPQEQSTAQTEVRLDAGWVRGVLDDEVHRFSGIPYAASPTGARRWTAPSPPDRWTGIRDATKAAPVCPQVDYTAGSPAVVGEEDCLHLNVVRPVKPSRPGPLPVIVWLHGGNLATGSGTQYDGARLATGGDVVVVTLNYRLGALGFLSSAVLDDDATTSGNFGLLDQAEALRWVRRNIAAFGGDPGRVTLAGQSAGARSLCAHLASPGSHGLFQRAILQSGACANPVTTKAAADKLGAKAIAQVGCADAADTADCLRRVPVSDLVFKALVDERPTVFSERREDPWGPVAGTPYLPRQPVRAIRHGSAAGVPLLVGSTHDEMRAFVNRRYAGLTADQYTGQIHTEFGADAEAILEQYPAEDSAHPALALASVLTDWGGGIGACPVLGTARTASRHAPVYAYELIEESPQTAGGLPLGAYHGWDLPFLMDTSIPLSEYPDLSAAQQRLSATMIDYWTAFVREGDPNSPGRPAWAPVRNGSGPVLGLAAEKIAPTPFADDHHCEFWDQFD